MKAYIKAIEYYLPQKILSNKDLAQLFPEWSEEKIFEKVGIKNRHIAGEKETALDMAEQATKKLFEKDIIKKDEIDFILFCTQSPDYKLPPNACILQNRLGLSEHCGALDFNLGCSGYGYGLAIAQGLVSYGIAKHILFCTSETYSKYIHPNDKSNLSIFGDAATASLISTEGFAEICEFDFGTDGSGFEDLIIKTGASKNPLNLNIISKDEDNHIISPDHIYMDGSNIFSFTLKQVPKMVNMLFEKSGLSKNDIDLFIFHQANVFILEFLRKKLKIDSSHFYYCIENVGNTVSNTIPLALCNALKEGILDGKRNILLAGFGVGLSWSGCILHLKNEK